MHVIIALLSACCNTVNYVLISGLNQQLIFKLQILGTDVVYTFKHPISGKQEAEIFDPVIVNPEIVLFPWYPLSPQNTAAQNQFQYLLEVTKLLAAAYAYYYINNTV